MKTAQTAQTFFEDWGVSKTKTRKTPKTPKTLKLENKDPHILGGFEFTTSRSPMRLQVERWRGDKNFERGIKILNLLLTVYKTSVF